MGFKSEVVPDRNVASIFYRKATQLGGKSNASDFPDISMMLTVLMLRKFIAVMEIKMN
jgi:hypothetical protein